MQPWTDLVWSIPLIVDPACVT